jgi:hypothetical protein
MRTGAIGGNNHCTLLKCNPGLVLKSTGGGQERFSTLRPATWAKGKKEGMRFIK